MEISNLHEEFCQYCLLFKNYRLSTIKGYKYSFKLLLKDTDIKNIEDATPEKIRYFFFNGRINRKWSSITFIDYRKELMVFFKWCVKNNYIIKNPLDGLEKPKLEKRLPKNLTIEETSNLLEITRNLVVTNDFIRKRNYAIMAMFVYCGLRSNELLHLKLVDVDLKNQIVSVIQGKGAKDRNVPIPLKLIPILEDYLKERFRLKKTCYYFFTSSRRDCGFTKEGLKRLVNDLKKISGIDFHIHMLRHTFATLMLEGGCDIFSLSKMMGHSDIKTTTIYLGVSMHHLKMEIQKHPLQNLDFRSYS